MTPGVLLGRLIMTLKFCRPAIALAVCSIFFVPTNAFAFCGVIQESASARTANKALRRADTVVRKQVRSLRRQHGQKLQLSERQSSCVGGGVGIDANGNQITGNPSCTVTQPFCVNP
jgi:hypothetical protein